MTWQTERAVFVAPQVFALAVPAAFLAMEARAIRALAGSYLGVNLISPQRVLIER